MTVLDALKDLKACLEKVLSEGDMLFQQEETDPPQYVKPYVQICYYPHKNFTPGGFQAPGVLISLDEAEDGPQENTVAIRLLCTTYGGGYYEGTGIPDNKGYIDLINLMERLKVALITQWTLGRSALNKPVQMGMYDAELAWPYWYGYLSFDLQIPVTEYPMRTAEMEEFLHGRD